MTALKKCLDVIGYQPLMISRKETKNEMLMFNSFRWHLYMITEIDRLVQSRMGRCTIVQNCMFLGTVIMTGQLLK